MESDGEQTRLKADKDAAAKDTFCKRVFLSKACLPVLAFSMLAGIAVAVVVTLKSENIRDRYPPKMKWWKKTVVYQIYPRSFKDSDGDGIGDLPGITSKLDYLEQLGAETLWISPFYPSPMKDFGYDISDYRAVDPMFGTLDDFDDLVEKAHKKDLRVVVDFVAGHTSSENSWFNRSLHEEGKYKDYYIWSNGTRLPNGTMAPPNNWVSAFGHSSWEWREERQQFYYHAFLPSQPTLNYRSTDVQEEMKDVLRFWLDRGVDGIRVDAIGNIMVTDDLSQDEVRSYTPGAQPWQSEYYVHNLTHDLPEIRQVVQGWREVLDDYDDSHRNTDNYKVMIVELYKGPEGRKKYFDYGANLPFNFQLLQALSRKPGDPLSCNGNASCVRDVIQAEYDALPEGEWANFVLGNHDNNRVASRYGARYVDALNVLLLTLRGTPTTYYGEELGMQDIHVSYRDTQDPFGINYGPLHYTEVSRDPERSPMQWNNTDNAQFSNSTHPWLPVNSDYVHVNVESELNSDLTTAIKVYKDAVALRSVPAFHYGDQNFTVVTNNVISFYRSALGRASYLVALNIGDQTETNNFFVDPVKVGQGRVRLVTSAAANGERFEKGARMDLGSVTLQPGDGLVIELSD